jgi:hypothetical protein
MHPLLFSSTQLLFLSFVSCRGALYLGIDLIDERKNWWLEKKTKKGRRIG